MWDEGSEEREVGRGHVSVEGFGLVVQLVRGVRVIDRYLSSYIPRPTPPLPPPPGRHVDTNKRRRQTKDERRDTGAVQFALSTAQAQQATCLSTLLLFQQSSYPIFFGMQVSARYFSFTS